MVIYEYLCSLCIKKVSFFYCKGYFYIGATLLQHISIMYLNILPIFFFRNLLNISNTSKKKKIELPGLEKRIFFMQKKKQMGQCMTINVKLIDIMTLLLLSN